MKRTSFMASSDETRNHHEAVRLLVRIDVFSVLSDDQIGELARSAKVVHYEAGELIVRQGQQGHALYVVGSGLCEVFLEHEAADDTKIATIGSGGFFGEMSLLTGEPVVATVRALKHSVLLAIDKAIFASIMEDNPELAEKLGQVLTERQQGFTRITGQPLKHSSSGNLVKRIKSFFRLD